MKENDSDFLNRLAEWNDKRILDIRVTASAS